MARLYPYDIAFTNSIFLMVVFQEHEKEILQVLNNASLRNVLLLIIEKKNPSKHEITKFLNISYSSVNWHLEQLMSYDMIVENK